MNWLSILSTPILETLVTLVSSPSSANCTPRHGGSGSCLGLRWRSNTGEDQHRQHGSERRASGRRGAERDTAGRFEGGAGRLAVCRRSDRVGQGGISAGQNFGRGLPPACRK